MKLAAWAKQQGVSYITAWRWFQAGKISGAFQMDTGTILVPDPVAGERADRVLVYARVSNRERKASLDTQAERCVAFANARGLSVDKVYKEIASGMNDTRQELWRALNSKPTVLIVENRDRLTRFGFVYLERLLAAQGCEVMVLNQSGQDEEDLLRDLTSVIYSFCARLYGRRRAKNKLKDIKACL